MSTKIITIYNENHEAIHLNVDDTPITTEVVDGKTITTVPIERKLVSSLSQYFIFKAFLEKITQRFVDAGYETPEAFISEKQVVEE